MKLEIDQSGKIEETHRDTYLAFSNGKTYTVRISARTKRRLQESFRKMGRPRDYVVGVFSVALYELVKDHLSSIDELVIDLEYPSHEILITRILEAIFAHYHLTHTPEIHFSLIGKKSRAHKAANNAFKKKSSANKILTYDALAEECFVYKNGYPVLKYLVGKDQ